MSRVRNDGGPAPRRQTPAHVCEVQQSRACSQVLRQVRALPLPCVRQTDMWGRNCQKADWPKHKPVCGKVFDAQDALDLFGGDAAKPEPEPAAPQDDDEADEFPTPEPPFAHSRHLKHQIRLLKENPQMDYLIVQPAPHPDFGLMLQDPMGRMMFLLLRRRAMQSGDTHAVLMMYKYLAECAQQNGVALRKVKDQLCLEYGVDAKMLDNASLD